MCGRASMLRRLACRRGRRTAVLARWSGLRPGGARPLIKGLEHLDAKRLDRSRPGLRRRPAGRPEGEQRDAPGTACAMGTSPIATRGSPSTTSGATTRRWPRWRSRPGRATPEATRYVDLARNRILQVAVPRVLRGTWWDYYERGAQSILTPAPGRPPSGTSARRASSATRKTAARERTASLHRVLPRPRSRSRALPGRPVQGRASRRWRNRWPAIQRPRARTSTTCHARRSSPAGGRRHHAAPDQDRRTGRWPADQRAGTMEVSAAPPSPRTRFAQVEVNGEAQLIDAADGQPALHAAGAPGAGNDTPIEVLATGPASGSGDRGRSSTSWWTARARWWSSTGRRGSGGRIRLEGTVFDNVRLGRCVINGQATHGAQRGRREQDSPPTWPGTETVFQIGPPTRSATSRVCGSRFPPSCVRVATASSRRSCRWWRAADRAVVFLRAPMALAIEMERSRPRSSRILSPSRGSSPLARPASTINRGHRRRMRQTEAGQAADLQPHRAAGRRAQPDHDHRHGPLRRHRHQDRQRRAQGRGGRADRLPPGVAVPPPSRRRARRPISTVEPSELLVDRAGNQGRFKVVSHRSSNEHPRAS